MKGKADWNTSHCRQSFILSSKLCWRAPWQYVPLSNQQKYLALYSHTMQFSLHSPGQPFTSQHDLLLVSMPFFRDKMISSCLSALKGICLHPCSKLCTALGETLSRPANCTCVLPRKWRIRTRSLLFMVNSFYLQQHYTTVWSIVRTGSYSPSSKPYWHGSKMKSLGQTYEVIGLPIR